MINRTIFVLLAMVGGRAKRAQRSAEGGKSVICAHQIIKPTNSLKVEIGEHFTHRWSCSEEYGPNRYVLFVRNCEQIERNGKRIILTDKFGCPSEGVPAGHFSLNYSDSTRHNANNSSLLTVFGHSQLFSSPVGSLFRIECILLLVPKVGGANATELPNCSRNSSTAGRENVLSKLLTPTMANQKRFIDMVETSVSSQWIRVGDGHKDRPALSKHFGTFLEKLSSGSKEHREEAPNMALNPFLERAYSIFATSVPTVPSIPPTAITAPPTRSTVPNAEPVTPTAPATVPPMAQFTPSTVSDTEGAIPSSSPKEPATPSFSSSLPLIGIRRDGSSSSPPNLGNLNTPSENKHPKFESHHYVRQQNEQISQETSQNSFYVNVSCPFFHNASTPSPSRHCSWSMLNTALLTWSIFSTLHWLCLLGGKLRSSVIVHRRLTISPKQKMAAAKMNAMRRKMMRTKHCGGFKHRKSLIECPDNGTTDRKSPSERRRAQQKALRTVRQRHLLHRTVIGAMPPLGFDQPESVHQLSLSAATHRRQNQINDRRRRMVSNLGRIQEEEGEGKRGCHRQEKSGAGILDGRSEGRAKSGGGRAVDDGRAENGEQIAVEQITTPSIGNALQMITARHFRSCFLD
uniref:ZP domain-containing protein n=1 Tax=Globodera rostochiensis TaxID=31243 RepID=A0A914I7X3_GLORO